MTRRLIDNGTTNNLMYAFCEASSSFHGVEPVTAPNVQRGLIQHSIICRDDDRGLRPDDTDAASIPLAAELPATTVRWTEPGNRVKTGSRRTRTVATMSQASEN